MVHPAPLIKNDPRPKRRSIFESGKTPGGDDRAMLHAQGRNTNQVPFKSNFDLKELHNKD